MPYIDVKKKVGYHFERGGAVEDLWRSPRPHSAPPVATDLECENVKPLLVFKSENLKELGIRKADVTDIPYHGHPILYGLP